MEDETKAVDEFLGDLKTTEDTDPFNPQNNADTLNLGDETGATGETGQGETGDDEPSGKAVPFNQDPKIQRYLARELKKQVDAEVARRLKESTPAPQNTTTDKPDNLDEILTRIIGNDTPEKVMAVKDLKKELLNIKDLSVTQTLQQLEATKLQEQQAEREAEETLMDGFEAIEAEYNVDITSNAPLARKLRGQFIDFIKKIAPKDADGDILDYPDLPGTFAIFQQQKPQTAPADKAKKIASRTMERGLGGEDKKNLPEDKSWGAVDRVFEKLLS